MEPKRIVVVDDSYGFARGVKKYLGTNLHASVNIYPNGETALSYTPADTDLFLVDYRLGKGMTGVEVVLMLRQVHKDCKIIGMSSDELADVFKEAGADDFFYKSQGNGPEELLRLIQKL